MQISEKSEVSNLQDFSSILPNNAKEIIKPALEIIKIINKSDNKNDFKLNEDEKKIIKHFLRDQLFDSSSENEGKKVKRLKEAAGLGHIEAMNQLGTCYENGDGVSFDEEKSFKYFQKAAKKGHPEGQYNTAYALANGIGTEEDQDKSLKWYQESARNGCAYAQEHLNEIEVPYEDIGSISEQKPQLDIDTLFHALEIESFSCKSQENLYFSNSCRFFNVLCPKDTAVGIKSDAIYLHANRVSLNGKDFIAAQYPLPDVLDLFWKTSQTSSLIVDLTNANDDIESYAPTAYLKRDEFKVFFKEKHEFVNSVLYSYRIENLSSDSQQTNSIDKKRLHYYNWHDAQGIEMNELQNLINLINQHKDSNGPIMIHCKAGVGRTGTLIIAIVLSSLIQNGTINQDNFIVQLRQLIIQGRMMRGPGFVNNSGQLHTLIDWGNKLLSASVAVEK